LQLRDIHTNELVCSLLLGHAQLCLSLSNVLINFLQTSFSHYQSNSLDILLILSKPAILHTHLIFHFKTLQLRLSQTSLEALAFALQLFPSSEQDILKVEFLLFSCKASVFGLTQEQKLALVSSKSDLKGNLLSKVRIFENRELNSQKLNKLFECIQLSK